MPTIDELTGMLSDVTARLFRLEGRSVQTPSPTSDPAPVHVLAPFWDMTRCTGLTLTTGTALDWDPLFDDPGAADWHKASPAMGRGCFDQGNLGFAYQRRIVASWDSAAACTVKLWIGGTSVYTADADAAIQVKMNGAMTEYGAGSGPFVNVAQVVDLSVKAGRNRLAIVTDTHPDTLQVSGILFDETRGDTWLDPRQFDNYRRSTR